jgi:uncharacterized integral membrane protein (TIGR00698 family)
MPEKSSEESLQVAEIVQTPPGSWRDLLTAEDWWAVWIAAAILLAALGAVYAARPSDWLNRLTDIKRHTERLEQLRGSTSPQQLEEQRQKLDKLRKTSAPNPLAPWIAKLQRWQQLPWKAFCVEKDGQTVWLVGPIVTVFLISVTLFGAGNAAMGRSCIRFAAGFAVVFLLAVLSFVLANQAVIRYYNLEYPLWALLIGLLISNTLGTPRFVRFATQTEFFIKTGVVLLGAEILWNKFLTLGIPGIFVAWVVTPIVLVCTYAFGQRVLRVPSRTLNITLSADMSVCGVSAAIATAAACRAKKEELSLAIGISLIFTVIMMVLMPAAIRAMRLSEVLGGAWIGGTIDSSGAVAAAGAMLGRTAEQVAITVKMIQNMLIGVIAFGVAVYWVTYVERSGARSRPSLWEIWYRFPKFVIGFVGASAFFSWVGSTVPGGTLMAESVISGTSEPLRSWFFCLAFVSIGLETNFRQFAPYLKDGKAVVLYVCGQTFNLCLTLAAAWLMFEVVFKDAVAVYFRQ